MQLGEVVGREDLDEVVVVSADLVHSTLTQHVQFTVQQSDAADLIALWKRVDHFRICINRYSDVVRDFGLI